MGTGGYAMKPRSRPRHKGRRESGTFTAIPHAVQDCANWRQCSGTGIKLLLDLARQYNGRNNGDLSAALSLLRPFGWNSPDTVGNALRELRHYGFLLLTRQGGLHGPSLYALTWQAIDDCGGKLTCAHATNVAPGTWKESREPFKRPPKNRKPTTPSVAHRYAIRSAEGEKAA
jgi:hypothetical protein